MPTVTPRKLDATVASFCRGLSRHPPVYVPVRPESDAEAVECFFNVGQKVGRDGGGIRYGWAVWIWPRVFIEAEHHAVWEAPDGTLVDVTPTLNGEARVLFVPDPERVYDYENHRRLDNVRKALTNDPDVRAFLTLAARVAALIEDNSVGRMASVPADELRRLNSLRRDHYAAMLRKFMGRNDPCFCGSGRKYKVCCMG